MFIFYSAVFVPLQRLFIFYFAFLYPYKRCFLFILRFCTPTKGQFFLNFEFCRPTKILVQSNNVKSSVFLDGVASCYSVAYEPFECLK